MKTKNIEYYMGLNYDVGLHVYSEEEGGGYRAYIPFLGSGAFVGEGDTAEDAIEDLRECKEEIFGLWINEGTTIPEPPTGKEKEYSGRFMTRIPKTLHRQLAKEAEEQGVSMNLYVNNILSSKMTARR